MSQQSNAHKQGRYVEYDNQPGHLRYGEDQEGGGGGSAAQSSVESQFGGTQDWLQVALSEVTEKVNTDPATAVVAVAVTGDEIQDAIDASSDGDIIEVTNVGPYNPITLPAGQELTIRSTVLTQLTGAMCVRIPDGGADLLISGFVFPATLYSTPASNDRGAAISFAAQGSKCERVIIHNCSFEEVANGSAVMLCYHWSVGGDSYSAQQLLSENSDQIAFIDNVFVSACKDGIEGAAISLRGFNNAIMMGNQIDGGLEASRGIKLENCVDALVLNNECHNFLVAPASNGEGVKFDQWGVPVTATFKTTGRMEGNVCYDCNRAGLKADDGADALIINNLCYDCAGDGISAGGDDGGPNTDVVKNRVYGCTDGIHYPEADPGEDPVTGIYYGNVVYGNTNRNYLIESEYVENLDVWLLGVEPE